MRGGGRPATARRPARRRWTSAWWPALLVVLLGVVLLVWDADGTRPPAITPVAAGCTVAGSALTLSTEQAAHTATIAAVARTRGLPERAVVIALATAQQESRLRNLDYGDRDSLGLFQQRPSQGWGTEAQVQDPVYAAGKFYDGLVQVPGWETGRLTDVAQSVQVSGFPQAYQQWEPMAQQLTAALTSTAPAQLSCSFRAADAPGPLAERTAVVATVATAQVAAASARADGVVTVDPAAGWPGATWAVAHAERLQLTQVEHAGWRWTPDGGWAATPGADGAGIHLELAR